HAIARFRARLCRYGSVDHIERAIRGALATPHSIKRRHLRDGTPSLTIRARDLAIDDRTYTFRLVVVPASIAGNPPVVATVLHGTAGWSRGTKLPPRPAMVWR